ncbi:GPI transamidase component PIG-T [Phlebotomus argentipes]|uniref:GPI transamidase component PIG-T n=1 Tax=Phlebotomus argentipes TaxID=94469 RepID=UPI0028933445|nr:GPI transamidase component PIG-T [Phlebotomus argentipes]
MEQRMMFWFVLLLLFSVKLALGVGYQDEFHEELFVKPLPSGHINTFFQFTTKWHYSDKGDLHHTHLAPRSLAEIFHVYSLRELHVSLTNVLWRYESWGYPVVEAGPGAEVWAWFDAQNDQNTPQRIDEQWRNLVATLSGLLCASLGFIDDTNTVQPHFTIRPQFYSSLPVNSSFVRYSTLPHEVVCTENLTPWKKLLPCGHKEGFLSLLNSHHIHVTNYHSLGIHVRQLSSARSPRKTLEIKQTVNLVYDQIVLGGKDWSVRKLFGQGLSGSCPLAESSKIYLDMTHCGHLDFSPPPENTVTSKRGGIETTFAVYDIKKEIPGRMFNLAAVRREEAKPSVTLASPPPLYAKRYILGVGQERGRIVTKIVNTHWAELNVIVQENIPWFVPIYLHTLTLKLANGQVIRPATIKYIPGRQRQRAYHLEVAFRLPARSTVEMSIHFDYIFLKWQEYPPDANHGHYLGSAIVAAQLPIARNFTAVPVDGSLFADSFNASRPGYYVQIRTESLLLTLPTPDFSMPYNVICLACTVVALAFGPIHNMSTKRIVILPKEAPKSLLATLRQKLGFAAKAKGQQETDSQSHEKSE